MGSSSSCMQRPKKKRKRRDDDDSSSDNNSDYKSDSDEYKGSNRTSDTQASDEEEEEEEKEMQKVILVGAGEAGKSSVFKILTYQYSKMFTDESDLLEFRESIHENVLEATKMIISKCEELKEYTDEDGKYFDCRISDLLEDEVERILSIEVDEINSGDVDAIHKLLKDEGFDTCLKKLRHLYYIPDGAVYFYKHLERIGDSKYVPSFQDCINCRDRTTGVTHEEIPWKYEGRTVYINLFDVGGQRGERKVWQKIFKGVNAIIFVLAISEFDMFCIEDNKTGRLLESLVVLKVLNQSAIFKDKPILLIFTKVDQLEKKLNEGREFKLDPPDNGLINFDPYRGKNTLEDIKEFVLDVCMKQIKGEKKVVPCFKNLVAKNVSLDNEIKELLL